ncbi:MAG: hypothetical protein RL577_47 [Bacteroidota bacterium]
MKGLKCCVWAVALLGAISALEAQVTVKGRVQDAVTDEWLSGVTVSAKSISAETDAQGLFSLELPMGEYSLVAAIDGYSNDTLFVQGDRPLVNGLVFRLENQSASIQAVQITASIAKDRKTPIAYSNLSSRDLNERLGSQDMPLLLNQTPGVYATSQGGGAGDARITIRGFNQRNIAVMIDGIPVNDMENGWVYWSNWFGLSSVTALTQVQRGLGSSRIANPAVGGTMNIITKGLGNKEYLEANIETGDSRYQKFGFTYASGRLPGDWGFTLNFTKRSSTGYVDALYDDMYAYFAKVEKQWGQKHTLSLTAMGAPQSHGQRSYRARLQLYDAALAQDMNMYDPNNPNMAIDRGRRYNQHWGEFYQASVDPNTGDTTWGSLRKLNERENMFHKPQIYLKHDYRPNADLLISSTVYVSIGTGGGTSAYGSRIKQYPSLYGQYNFQDIWFLNTVGNFFIDPIDPQYSDSEKKSMGIIQRSVNNHTWVGALTTAQRKLNERWSLTGGIDLRTYQGQHYREAYDLLGGDYFIPDVRDLNPAYDAKHMYKVGDIHGYHNDGLVRWAGAFSELEYARARSSAFLNVSSSGSWYKRIDYFNGPNRGQAFETDWVFRQGFTVKSGFNQNISRRLNVFTNVGYLNRPTRFNNIFDTKNRVVQSAKNELVYSAEAGMGYRSKRLALNWNAYYTNWANKPADYLPVFTDPDGNQFSYNINNISARHMGQELQASFKAGDGISIEYSQSLGDWIWSSGSRAIIQNDQGDSIGVVDFDATGVHVGDAAQNQQAFLIRWEPTQLKGAYASVQYVRFAKQFADFDPTALQGVYAQTESIRIPDYWYLNLTAGYRFTMSNGLRVSLYASANNVTNNLYISDAQHRSVNGDPEATFKPENLEVYVSTGLRYTTGIRLSF